MTMTGWLLLSTFFFQLAESPPLSVCRIFSQPFPSLRGFVIIRGTLEQGALRDPSCEGTFTIERQEWPRAVLTGYPERTDVDRTLLTKPGDLSVEEFGRRYRDVFADRKKQIIATFIGRLLYRERYEGQRNSQGGGFVGNGFGKFGIFPVEMEVHAVRGISIIEK